MHDLRPVKHSFIVQVLLMHTALVSVKGILQITGFSRNALQKLVAC